MITKDNLKNFVAAVDPSNEHIVFSEDTDSEMFGVRCDAMDDFALVVYPDGKIEDSFSRLIAELDVPQYLSDFCADCRAHKP